MSPFRVDLGHAAMFGIAQGPDQGDDVEAELALRQSPGTLVFRTVAPMIELAVAIGTAADRHDEAT